MGLYDPSDERKPENPVPLQPNPAQAPRLPRPALFQLGQIVATPGAIETMNRRGIDPATLLYRHVSGDWGDLDEHDKAVNEAALKQGGRIFSAYGVRPDPDRLYVITELGPQRYDDTPS